MASHFECVYEKGKPSMTTAVELSYRLQVWGKNGDSHWLWPSERRQEPELTWEEPGPGDITVTTAQ